MTTTKYSLWMDEHSEANVPAVVWQHPLLDDVSWHNDTMPSFVRKRKTDEPVEGFNPTAKDIRLYVDYADPKLREHSEAIARYGVYEHAYDSTEIVVTHYEGNNAQDAINALLSATKK